ncbi:hypothetical protein MBOU_08600 [Mycobacterium bourgelatii]|uniref:Uncharacterized protein n=1 Tax=Mycobacterium bourgelatii TaxID=1273442 RepID=A0A7I9YJL6_MYCBU|nr:hypothetical protein MBOU_08600 [Mycobacterium bourgelatii]
MRQLADGQNQLVHTYPYGWPVLAKRHSWKRVRRPAIVADIREEDGAMNSAELRPNTGLTRGYIGAGVSLSRAEVFVDQLHS